MKLGQTIFILLVAMLMVTNKSTAALTPTPPAGDATEKVFLPIILKGKPPAVHAMRLEYPDLATSRALVDTMETRMQRAGINMVGLGAGRVEWTYFKWAGHENNWSNDVKDTGIDFLAEDATRFRKWAHIDAVVDVFAPNYIKTHPETAAISFFGQPSENLVSTTELVEGNFGKQLLAMVEAIAANYPVDSISLTELFYHSDGYGADDKASYLAYSGRTDWPRLSDGTIDINDKSIGDWRTHVLDIFLDKIVAICHQHGKQFFMDVALSLDDLTKMTNEHGTNYKVVLEHTDRLVVWGYFRLDNYPPQNFVSIAQFLTQFGQDHVILSVGLWDENNQVAPPDSVRIAIQSIEQGGIPNIWVTPSLLMSAEHWQVLNDLWGK
jgi:hypothetical protein